MSVRTSTQTFAVSESIGFLLIFTMVIVGIGLVTLYGYPMLLQQQTSADEQIMEKNMIVLQNDVKSLSYKTVPYTETSLKVGGGSLTVYNTSPSPPSPYPPSSTIDIFDDGGHPYASGGFVSSFHSGELRYESVSADRDISLQNGAVVARNLIEKGSTMLAEPRWYYDSTTNTMVINLIGINSTASMSRAGVGDVQMGLNTANFTVWNLNGATVSVNYTPDTVQDYSVAWDDYFRNSQKMIRTSGTPGTGTPVQYTLPFDLARPETLVIKKYDVIIQTL